MDVRRIKNHDDNKLNNKEKVVKMAVITPAKPEQNVQMKGTGTNMNNKEKKKRSALEISDAIGVYGAFGRTLSDIHKQGR